MFASIQKILILISYTSFLLSWLVNGMAEAEVCSSALCSCDVLGQWSFDWGRKGANEKLFYFVIN